MMKAFLGFALAAAGAVALAQTPAIDAARSAGQLGERFDGYIGLAAPVSGIVRMQTVGAG